MYKCIISENCSSIFLVLFYSTWLELRLRFAKFSHTIKEMQRNKYDFVGNYLYDISVSLI